ncbi:guanylate kinase [Verrucomicrobiota bacterium sgz303538]
MESSSPIVEPSRTFHRRGILFVVSAPSGAGKSTLLNALRPTADFVYSISCTTRAPRPGEIHGEDYYFLSREEFEERLANGEFLEHANVHGNYYGTRRDTVLMNLETGVDVLIDIDVQGARNIRNDCDLIRDAVADIFIMPPSQAELRHRLIKRGTETPEQIETRLRNAADEMECWKEYRYTIVSGSIEEDLQKFRAIMRAERYLSRRMNLTIE